MITAISPKKEIADRLACSSLEEPANRVNTTLRLEMLRKVMASFHVDAYVITGDDQHQVPIHTNQQQLCRHLCVFIANRVCVSRQRETPIYLGFYGHFWHSRRDGQQGRLVDRRPLLSAGGSATRLPLDPHEIGTATGPLCLYTNFSLLKHV